MRVVRRWLPLVVTSGALLAWSNLLVPTLGSSTGVRAAVNIGAAGALALAARAGGITGPEMGLNPRNWRSGLRWGGAALAVVTAGYAAALAIPAVRTLLADAEATTPLAELLWRALVHIPLGSVLAEELAYRGVLLAHARRQLPDGAANVVTAVVFGLWHVTGAGSSAVGTVAATTAAGLGFTWLRLRSGSLLAPIGLHLGTNTMGVLVSPVAAALSR